MSFRFLLAVGCVFCAGSDVRAQDEVPARVLEALQVRQTPFCWGAGSEPRITRESVDYFPQLTVYVSRCDMYFGLPSTVAVGTDTTGHLFLLDSPANVRLLEQRYGRPPVDSTNIVDYVLAAAKLEGAIEWDATLATAPGALDPRRLAPLYRTDGDCDRAQKPLFFRHGDVWDVYLDVAGSISIDRVQLLVLTDWYGGVHVEPVCAAMHNN